MAKCTYEFIDNGNRVHKFEGYREMMDYFLNTEGTLENVIDLVMSATDRKEFIAGKINKIKNESRTMAREGRTDGAHIEADIDVKDESKTVTVRNFLNGEFFSIDEQTPAFVFDRETYMEKRIEEKKSKGMSEDKARAGAKALSDRWDTVSKDAYDLHMLFLDRNNKNEIVLEKNAAETSFSSVPIDELYNAREKVYKQYLGSSSVKNPDYKGSKPERIFNISFSAPIQNTGGEIEKVVGHTDFITVWDDGTVDIYNMAVSMDPYSEWPGEKKEEYRYEFAMIKRILAANGVDVSNVRGTIIPIQIVYDDAFETIKGVNVQNSVRLDIVNGTLDTQKYDNAVSRYVLADVPEENFDMSCLEEAQKTVDAIFGDSDIRADYIRISAKKWVKDNWKNLNPKILSDGGYELTIPELDNRKVTVKDTRKGSDNEELVNWVEKNMSEGYESFTGKNSTSAFISDVEHSLNTYGYLKSKVVNNNYNWTSMVMSEYFEQLPNESDPDSKSFNYVWKIWKSTATDAANLIFMFNKITGQLDVVALTQLDPGMVHQLEPSFDNLLGKYLKSDMDPDFQMKATWGNIESVRILSVIDSMAKQLKGLKFGKLVLISKNRFNTMKGDIIPFKYLFDQWGKIVRIVNRETGGKAGLVDNIHGEELSVMSAQETLVNIYNEIRQCRDSNLDMADMGEPLKRLIYGYRDEWGDFTPGIVNENSEQGKRELLEKLLMKINEISRSEENMFGNLLDPKKVANMVKQKGKGGYLARLWKAALDMYRLYTNTYVDSVEELTWFEEHIQRAGVVSEPSYARAVTVINDAIAIVNNRMADNYLMDTVNYFRKYQAKCGYGNARKVIIGDISKIYEPLFVKDENGKNTFILQNPYDRYSPLREHERQFLKEILYEFYKCRCRVLGVDPVIKGIEDEKLYTAMPKHYLNLPLQKASKETQFSHLDEVLHNFSEQMWEGIRHPLESLKKLGKKIFSTARADEARRAFENFTVRNPYADKESDEYKWTAYRDEMGPDYFETNIENVFIDYLFAQTRAEEMQKTLYKISGIELALQFKSDNYSDEDMVKNIIRAIDDYTLINVYEGTIMDKAGQYLENALRGLRRMTSEILFGNNLMGLTRDFIDGIQKNLFNTLIKFNTSISFNSLKKSVEFVFTDCMKSVKDMGILKQLNIRYGFSSFDYGNVSNKLKDNTGWMYDWQKWVYWTMKAPDFVNRMTLFVARMYEDGSIGAYTLDEDGNVKYDWRKDERFSALARKDKSDPKYNDQLAHYLSLIDEFKKDFPEKNLVVTDYDNLPDLPDAYTIRQIREIKKLGEQMYGAYDKASRNKLEHMAIGRNFMFFFAFWNGLTDIYLGKKRVSDTVIVERQKRDENGNLLYYDVVNPGQLTTKETPYKAYEHISGMDAGIFITLKDGWNYLKTHGWDFKDYYTNTIKNNPVYVRNYRKLLLDMSVMAISSLLIGLVVRPAYLKHKKNADPEKLAQNIAIELLYRGWSRSYDFYSGPLALVKYFGDSTNPVTYDMGSKMLTDVYKILAGKVGFGSTMLSYNAFYRSMQDSLKLYFKDMAEQKATLSLAEERKRDKELLNKARQ